MKSLYLLLLLTGSVPFVQSVSPKYILINQGKNWKDAQAYCRTTYTDLAIIDNEENVDRFQSDPQIQQLTSRAWIGLYVDINSWRWSFGNEPLGSMTKWAFGEPNNSGGRQECIAIKPAGWTDKGCELKYPFVCLDDSKTGTERYIYISKQMTWFEAQSYCRYYHTDLVSIKDETEYSIIFSLISGDMWIGLFRDSWKWVDKSNFSTVSWMSGQPDNDQRPENCGYVNNSMAGDARCSELKPFICYSEITGRKEVLKLKVRSDQDMKDPAVQLVILEQIKQKMKDGGIAGNITVKWRKQPDGLVFHKEDRNNTRDLGTCDLYVFP